GRQQAARNGAALAEHLGRDRLAELDFIASPLIRCVETMEIAREAAGLTRTGFATDDRLKEIRYGAWEGASLERLKREDRAAYVERRDNKFRWRPVDGESYADLLGRARDWAATIERDTVVVSHGGISRVLRALVTPLEDEEIPVQIVPQDKVLVLSKDRFDWV
ncbi:MAG: histidine phosphatase family protein, partial [Pseudomonadota bacterium]